MFCDIDDLNNFIMNDIDKHVFRIKKKKFVFKQQTYVQYDVWKLVVINEIQQIKFFFKEESINSSKNFESHFSQSKNFKSHFNSRRIVQFFFNSRRIFQSHFNSRRIFQYFFNSSRIFQSLFNSSRAFQFHFDSLSSFE
jgi:hypothetical protein